MGIVLLVFAVVFIVGFIVRGAYRVATTTKCPYCRAQISKSAGVCSQCGRDVS